jgi:MFS family permease
VSAGAHAAPAGGGRLDGVALAALAAALTTVFVAALDLTVISTILPGILFDLEVAITELDQAAWVVTAYLLAYTVAIPLLGRLSDRVGRWSVFLGALALFALGSLWCGLSGDLGTLIAGRVVQALGGGAMVPVTMALAADLLPPGRRGLALGLVAAVDTAGWVAGPLYGAAVVRLLGGWQWVFWLNLPLAVLAAGVVALAARRWRGRGLSPRPKGMPLGLGGLDLAGALLLTLALVGINLGLSAGAEPLNPGATLATAQAATSPLAAARWWLLGGGGLALVAFVLVERRARWPLVPVALWRRARFAAASLVNLLLGGALIVAMVNVPVLITTLASDFATAQWQSAALLTPLTGGMAPRRVALGGLLLAAGGFWLLSGWRPELGLPVMAAPLLGLGFGFGLVIAPAASVAVDSAEAGDHGVASALVLVLRLLGMAVGLSAMTAWALTQLSLRVAALPAPAALAGETAAAATARLAAEFAARALEVAVAVLSETFWLAALICLLALLPAWWLGRRESPGGAAR